MTVRLRSSLLIRLWALCLAGFIAACATAPPVQEMSDARQAIAAAKEAGAERLAVEQLDQAEELLVQAEKYLQTGGSGSYYAAKKAAISAKEIAFKALLTSRTASSSPGAESTE